MKTPVETDVLIVGAGPAGASAALFLAKLGISATLIDKESFPRDKVCGDALSGKTVEVLKKIDANFIDELQVHEKFLGSYGVTFVAPSGEALRVPFSSKRSKKTAPGFISKRIDFDNWLVEKVKNKTKIQLLEEIELRKYQRTSTGIIAESKCRKIFHAKIIISCDGALSYFSKNIAGLKTDPKHNCFGLRAYYKNVKGLDAANFIELHFLKEFLPGYFWIFPLPSGYANVGVGMRADKMSGKKINLKKSFESILKNNPVLYERFFSAQKIGDVKQYSLPLGSKKRNLSGDNYMLCGDAAMLIDPFTGEGIGNAMFSGMYAAEQAQRCLSNNNFSAAFMKQYDTELYKRLWGELQLSYRMQQLVNFPTLFNMVVSKANANPVLSETISCMFDDLYVRSQLRDPLFYFKLLFSRH